MDARPKSTVINVLLVLLVASSVSRTASAFGLAQPFLLKSTINNGRLSSSRLFFGLTAIEKQEEQYLQSATADPALSPESTVHVIVYDPNTEQEQVHFTEYPPQSGSFCLLAFESSLDCDHFAELIQVGVPGEIDTVATPYTLEQMEQFCQDMNVALYLVPPDSDSDS